MTHIERVPRSVTHGFEELVATLAVQVAPRIRGDLVFAEGKFRIPQKGHGGKGSVVPPAVLVAAVSTELPGGLDAAQREYIARAVVEHPAFRLALVRASATALPQGHRGA